MRIDAAGALISIDQFVWLFGAALIRQVIKIDGQQRRSLTDVSFAMIGRVGFENFR